MGPEEWLWARTAVRGVEAVVLPGARGPRAEPLVMDRRELKVTRAGGEEATVATISLAFRLKPTLRPTPAAPSKRPESAVPIREKPKRAERSTNARSNFEEAAEEGRGRVGHDHIQLIKYVYHYHQ